MDKVGKASFSAQLGLSLLLAGGQVSASPSIDKMIATGVEKTRVSAEADYRMTCMNSVKGKTSKEIAIESGQPEHSDWYRDQPDTYEPKQTMYPTEYSTCMEKKVDIVLHQPVHGFDEDRLNRAFGINCSGRDHNQCLKLVKFAAKRAKKLALEVVMANLGQQITVQVDLTSNKPKMSIVKRENR